MYKIRFQRNYTLTQFNIVRATKNCGTKGTAVTANEKGEYAMQQVDSIQPVSNVSTIFNRVVRFFGSSRFSTPQPDQVMTNIDWPDSDSKQSFCGRDNQPVSGGYNEAYIVQYWTSYQLR
jgi:hypothetical protein